MIFKDVKEIKKQLNDLKSTLTSNIEAKAQKADEYDDYLSKIKLKVKNVNEFYEEDGSVSLRINYEAPQIMLRFTEEGEPVFNELFKAINMLNLVDLDDMKKISDAIDAEKSKIRLTKL